MHFTVDPTVFRFAGRDIIKVTISVTNGTIVQPMYRSNGHNSGMPGTWLPFAGIAMGALDKTNYCVPAVESKFHRFGNQELKDLSDELGVMEIETGKERHHDLINEFLGVSFRD
jgi:hypothetical protein